LATKKRKKENQNEGQSGLTEDLLWPLLFGKGGDQLLSLRGLFLPFSTIAVFLPLFQNSRNNFIIAINCLESTCAKSWNYVLKKAASVFETFRDRI
jgi:hypothetical protein